MSPQDQTDKEKSKSKLVEQASLDESVIRAFRWLGRLSIGAVYLIGAMGLALIGESVVIFFLKLIHCEWLIAKLGVVEHPLHIATSGLEFLFLSPLAFLVLRSLGEYIEDLRNKDENAKKRKKSEVESVLAQIRKMRSGDEKAEATSSEADTTESGDVNDKYLPIGKECMLETKALTIALLFAIVATHLIGRLVSQHEQISVAEGTIGLILLTVLALIYFGIELLTRSLKKHDVEKHDRSGGSIHIQSADRRQP